MNIGIILISIGALIAGATLIKDSIRIKEKPKWVMKAHFIAGLFAIMWSLLTMVQEIGGKWLTDQSLTALKKYGSIFFGLFGGVLLTLWLSRQLSWKSDQKKAEESKSN